MRTVAYVDGVPVRQRDPVSDSFPAWVECDAIGPHHGDKCSGGRVQSPNAQFTRECDVCHGTGNKVSNA